MLSRAFRPVSRVARRTAAVQYSSLTNPLSGIPNQVGPRQERVVTHGSLSNGIQVATANFDTPAVGIGMLVSAGARYENHDTNGAGFFVTQMALSGTQNLSGLRVTRLVENVTGSFSAECEREYLKYSAEVLPDNLEDGLSLLAEMARPSLAEWEVRDSRDRVVRAAAEEEAASFHKHKLQQVAYGGLNVGRSKFGRHNLPVFTHQELQDYVAEHFVGHRITVVGAGVSQEEFQPLVEKYFSHIPSGTDVDEVTPVYLGGRLRVPERGPTRISVGFPAAGWSAPESGSALVLQKILGGGSVSSHSHLECSRLNRGLIGTGIAKSVNTYCDVGRDASLFGVNMAMKPTNVRVAANALRHVVEELKTTKPTDEEVKRAVAQTKFELVNLAATRNGTVSLLGRQSLFMKGSQNTVDMFCQALDKVTPTSVQAVASVMFSHNPTVVSTGNLDLLPTLDQVGRT